VPRAFTPRPGVYILDLELNPMEKGFSVGRGLLFASRRCRMGKLWWKGGCVCMYMCASV